MLGTTRSASPLNPGVLAQFTMMIHFEGMLHDNEMFRANRIISDQANRIADLEKLANDLLVRNQELEADLGQVNKSHQQQVKNLEDDLAYNMALRYAMANRLALHEPKSNFLSSPGYLQALKGMAISEFEKKRDWNDIRHLGNDFGTGDHGLSRENFISIAYIGSMWGALDARLANQSYDKKKEVEHTTLLAPAIVLRHILKDDSNPVLDMNQYQFIARAAGDHYDRLKDEGYFRSSPGAFPNHVAIEFGRNAGTHKPMASDIQYMQTAMASGDLPLSQHFELN